MIAGNRFFSIYTRFLVIVAFVALLPLNICFSQGLQAPKDKLNVVLLLDSSASMLINDPSKLRIEGARLLLQFLKSGDRLSIVSFDQQASLVRPPANFSSDQIPAIMTLLNSTEASGQYTDLNAGLLKAIEVLKTSLTDDLKPVIVLLSDGKMDPAPERGTAESHLDSLTTSILPNLKSNGFSVYTLSFSQDADRALLQHIAQATDGINWFTPNSETIHESFADLFLSLKKPQVVAGSEKGFKIETNIEEATFYVNQPEGSRLQIADPDEEVFSAQNTPENIRWFEGKKFSVVTIKNPVAGEWKLIGVNPDDGFATILTNLKLVTDWPNAIPVGEKVTLRARLYEGSLPVDLQAISEAVTLAFQITPSDRVSEPIIRELLNDNAESGDETASDGVFSSEFKLDQPGDYRLRIIAKGPTFERQLQLPFRVRPPLVHLNIVDHDSALAKDGEHEAEHQHEEAKDSADKGHAAKGKVINGSNTALFEIELNDEVSTFKDLKVKIIAIDKKRNKYTIDAKSAAEAAKHEEAHGAAKDSHSAKPKQKEKTSESLRYVGSATALPSDGLYELKAHLQAKSRDGKQIEEESEAIKFNRKTVVDVTSHQVEVKPEVKAPEPVKPEEESIIDIVSLIIVTLVNLGLGAGLFFMLKKTQKASAESTDFQLPEESPALTSRLQDLEKLAQVDNVDINDPKFKEALADTGSFASQAALKEQPEETGSTEEGA